MSLLGSLFGFGVKADIPALLQQGATVLDVRSPAEFAEGHVRGAINIPLDSLAKGLRKLPPGKPVIACCRSGARSAMALGLLRKNGFDAHNGGPWTRVAEHLKR